jgi:hypothetical protein
MKNRWRQEPIAVAHPGRVPTKLRLADYFHPQVARPERALPPETECALARAQSA